MIPQWMQRLSDGAVYVYNADNFAKGGFREITEEEKADIAAQRQLEKQRRALTAMGHPQYRPHAEIVTLPPFPDRTQPRYAIDHLQPQHADIPTYTCPDMRGFDSNGVVSVPTPVPQEDKDFAMSQITHRDPIPEPFRPKEAWQPAPMQYVPNLQQYAQEDQANTTNYMPDISQLKIIEESISHMGREALQRHAVRQGIDKFDRSVPVDQIRKVLIEMARRQAYGNSYGEAVNA